MDTTAFTTLETLHARIEKRGHSLILYGAPEQPARVLQALLPVLGKENLLLDRESAFRLTARIADAAQCRVDAATAATRRAQVGSRDAG